MDDRNALGEYLKARRELVRPEDAGIRVSGIRRVAGLRREEVAMLAGISSDYYLRLVSVCQSRPRTTARPRREVVSTGIRQLLDVLQQPAFVEGRYFDVLASNSFAVALSPNLAVGNNRLRDFFLDEREQALYPEWDRAAARVVAGFRASIGTDATDPRAVQLVGELSLASERFRQLWARHDVQIREGATSLIRHPEVGDLTVRREKLAIEGTDGQLLVIYHAAPGSETAGLLALLGSLGGSQHPVSEPNAAKAQLANPPRTQRSNIST